MGTRLEDRFGGGREVPALSSVGSGGRWLAGTEQAYGGQVGTLTGAVACTCSRARLRSGPSSPVGPCFSPSFYP